MSYCQVESLFYDRQLPRTARSWPSASSISVSRRERKALRLRHGSDSGMTAEMFRGRGLGTKLIQVDESASEGNGLTLMLVQQKHNFADEQN